MQQQYLPCVGSDRSIFSPPSPPSSLLSLGGELSNGCSSISGSSGPRLSRSLSPLFLSFLRPLSTHSPFPLTLSPPPKTLLLSSLPLLFSPALALLLCFLCGAVRCAPSCRNEAAVRRGGAGSRHLGGGLLERCPASLLLDGSSLIHAWRTHSPMPPNQLRITEVIM